MLSGWAIFLVYDTQSFVEHATPVRGEVIALQLVSSGRGTAYDPRVKYTDEGGEQRTFQASGSGFRILLPVLSVGETVDVLYDKANPVDARIASFWYLYLQPASSGGMAVLLICTAGVLMRAR